MTRRIAQGESTLFPTRKAGNLAVDRAVALLESGRPDEAVEAARDAQSLFGGENERLTALNRARESRAPDVSP